MNDRKILKAPEGMWYTNGKTYGKQIHLAQGTDEKTYYIISNDEWEAKFNNPEENGGFNVW